MPPRPVLAAGAALLAAAALSAAVAVSVTDDGARSAAAAAVSHTRYSCVAAAGGERYGSNKVRVDQLPTGCSATDRILAIPGGAYTNETTMPSTAAPTTSTVAATTTTPPSTVPGGPGPPAQAAAAGFTRLIFNDDFTAKLTDAPTGVQGFIDPAKWQSGYQWCYRASAGEYPATPEGACTATINGSNQNVGTYEWPQVKQPGDGLLHLVAQKAPAGYYTFPNKTVPAGQWVTGMVETFPKFSFAYGYTEARIKVAQQGRGLWPAYWLCAQADPVKCPPEIDVMEEPQTNGAVIDQYTNIWDASGNSAGQGVPLANTTAWHTYGLVWTPTKVEWWTDGAKVRTYTGPNIPQQAMYLILNHAVGGLSGFGGTPDASTPSPSEMTVDYVRAWGS